MGSFPNIHQQTHTAHCALDEQTGKQVTWSPHSHSFIHPFIHSLSEAFAIWHHGWCDNCCTTEDDTARLSEMLCYIARTHTAQRVQTGFLAVVGTQTCGHYPTPHLAITSPWIINEHKISHLLKLHFFFTVSCFFLPALAGRWQECRERSSLLPCDSVPPASWDTNSLSSKTLPRPKWNPLGTCLLQKLLIIGKHVLNSYWLHVRTWGVPENKAKSPLLQGLWGGDRLAS